MIITVLLGLLCQLDITGYAETRPYVLWGDSTRVVGFTRGWIEGKISARKYGAHLGLELVVPFDTIAAGFLFHDALRITRCAVWVGPEYVRISIGRQRINWGVGRVFRPLDIFNPVDYLEPGYERPGYDAVYGYLSLDNVTSLRGVYTPTYGFSRSTYGANIRTTFWHNDVGLAVLHRDKDAYTLAGGEIAGELLVGYWGEGAFVQYDTLDYSTYSIGIDYSFPMRLYAMVEYFFDGSGVDDPAQYDFSLIASGQRATLAQQYIYGSVSTIPMPFDVVRPSISALVNIDDQGVAIIPQISIVPFENTDVAVGVNFFTGSDACEFRNSIPFSGTAYIWAKVYF